MLACSKTVIRNRLKENTRKNLSLARAEKKGMSLIEAAKETYPAISKDDVRCDQVRDFAKRIADLKEKKERLVQDGRKIKEKKGVSDLTFISGNWGNNGCPFNWRNRRHPWI